MMTIHVGFDDVPDEKPVFLVEAGVVVGCLPVQLEQKPKPWSGEKIYTKKRLIAWEVK